MKRVQPPDLRFVLIIDGEEYILPNAPSGWEETVLNWARSQEYKGVVRTFTDRMDFVLDGAYLLRDLVYRRGIEAQAMLRVDLLNRTNWLYVQEYIGEIDFSEYEDTATHFSVNVMEGGFSRLVKAYEDVTFDIPLDIPEAVQVRIPGVPVTENVDYTVGADVFVPWIHFDESRMYVAGLPGMTVNTNEIDPADATVQGVVPVPEAPGDYHLGNSWFIQANTNMDLRISGFVTGSYGRNPLNDGSYKIQIQWYDDGFFGTARTLFNVTGDGQTHDFTADFDFEWHLAPGERLFVYVEGPNALTFTPTDMEFIVGGVLNISHAKVTPDTVCKAITAKQLFLQVCKKINNDVSFPVQSFLLDRWAQLKVTSGDAIRGIIDKPQVIRTTFREFFKSMDAVLGAGFGIDAGRAVLEDEAYFYQKSLQIIDLGEVKDVAVKPASEFIFSRVEAGYPDANYEREDGRDEFNSEQTYTSPMTRIQNVYDARSVYRADQFGIEEARVVTDQENTERKDVPTDNDTFMIYTQPTADGGGVYNVEGREAFTTVTGINPGTRYNMRISPKQNLLRHGQRLRSGLYRMEAHQITFTSGKKNVQLSTTDLTGRTVTENAPIPVAQLPAPLFYPFEAEFTTKLPQDIQSVIELRKYGYVQFTYMDNVFKGFVLEVSADVARNSERVFRLLLTPDNAMTKLSEDRRNPLPEPDPEPPEGGFDYTFNFPLS